MLSALHELSSIKVCLFILFLLVLNSIYPSHVLLLYQQGKVKWQNSSVDNLRDHHRRPSQTCLNVIGQNHIEDGSVLF